MRTVVDCIDVTRTLNLVFARSYFPVRVFFEYPLLRMKFLFSVSNDVSRTL